MIKRISKNITHYIVKNGADPQMEEIYEYALFCLLNEMLIDTILLSGAWFFGSLTEMVIWIVVFNSMRMNIGGFHAATPMACSIYSVILGWFSVWIGSYIELSGAWMTVVFLICFQIIYKTAPLLNPNHPLSEEKKRNAKKRGIYFLGLWWGLSIITTQVWKAGMIPIVFAVSTACLLLLFEYVRNQKLCN